MNQKMIKKKKKKNSDKDSLANEDGKSFKEDEKEFSYNNIKNILLADSNEIKKIIFDERVALKLKLRKYKINEFIEKVRFGFNNLDIESH